MTTEELLGYPRVTVSEADTNVTEKDWTGSATSSSVMEISKHHIEPVAADGPSGIESLSTTSKSTEGHKTVTCEVIIYRE